VEIVQMNGADAAVALVRGDVTMACAFGGPLDRMKTVGKPLMTGAEQEAAGINTFDVISVTDSFAKEHPDLVKKFLALTDAANAAYTAAPDGAYEKVSGAAGMDLDATKAMRADFGFPTNADQEGPKWVGRGVAVAVATHGGGGGNSERGDRGKQGHGDGHRGRETHEWHQHRGLAVAKHAARTGLAHKQRREEPRNDEKQRKAERVEEPARMLGGVKITGQTRAHAEEMLAQGMSGFSRDHESARKKKKSRA